MNKVRLIKSLIWLTREILHSTKKILSPCVYKNYTACILINLIFTVFNSFVFGNYSPHTFPWSTLFYDTETNHQQHFPHLNFKHFMMSSLSECTDFVRIVELCCYINSTVQWDTAFCLYSTLVWTGLITWILQYKLKVISSSLIRLVRIMITQIMKNTNLLNVILRSRYHSW